MFYLDLFSGIGGFALGAKWAGLEFEKHFFSEINKYAINIYKKRFPSAHALGDIRSVNYETLPKGKYFVTGGFPCQPHSVAGKRKGGGDERDLWPECRRMLRELRPEIALFENVPGLLVSDGGGFFNRILSDISASGYDTEWQIISASDVGALHLRKRVWIVCYKTGGVLLPDNICGMDRTYFPTPVASDATTGNIIGDSDTFYMTKTGMPRKINKQGADGSVGLARLVKLAPNIIIGTPTASMSKRSQKFGDGRLPSPAEYVQMWPTPTAKDYKDGSAESCKNVPVNNLLDRAVHLLPTPRAGMPGSRPNKKGGKTLSAEVKKDLWPTPKAQCGKAGGIHGQGGMDLQTAIETDNKKNAGQLNPDWVEALMGYPQYWTNPEKETIYETNFPAAWIDGTWENEISRITLETKYRMKRLEGLGNAVVPEIVEIICLIIKRWFLKI